MTGLLEGIAGIAGLGSAAKDVCDVLRERLKLEDVLADLVDEKFQEHLPRLQHLCPDGSPKFDKQEFARKLRIQTFTLVKPDDLQTTLLPHLVTTISTPGATCPESDFLPIYESIIESASRALWNKVSRLPTIAAGMQLAQNESLLKGQEQLKENIDRILDELAKFGKQVHTQVWEKLTDSAPPTQHTIDQQTYLNPFVLVRAEDFNHNYEKLARLFQDSPDWGSIQSRTDNVFIEGGRGTGKSMLLRRLTAQATIAAARLKKSNVTFDQLREDYFGVYVKLTRGYYEQFKSLENVSPESASLLAQHELNVEIFDAFVDTLRWLDKERAIQTPLDNWSSVVSDLSGLFPNAPTARTLDDLVQVVRFEQDQIISYYREKAFGNIGAYKGSASETVNFLRRLSDIFRKRLFPKREIRLFLLIDEFETLLELQQIALNTVIKMRLPDLSAKLAVRKSGRKTSETFTPGDPIQDPRDYIPIYVDYDIKDNKYKELLDGIAAKWAAPGSVDTTLS